MAPRNSTYRIRARYQVRYHEYITSIPGICNSQETRTPSEGFSKLIFSIGGRESLQKRRTTRPPISNLWKIPRRDRLKEATIPVCLPSPPLLRGIIGSERTHKCVCLCFPFVRVFSVDSLLKTRAVLPALCMYPVYVCITPASFENQTGSIAP